VVIRRSLSGEGTRPRYTGRLENLTRRRGEALEYCLQELNREHPDYQASQVYATLSVEEALRDLATAIGWAADRIRL
jgi:hypothetical protein